MKLIFVNHISNKGLGSFKHIYKYSNKISNAEEYIYLFSRNIFIRLIFKLIELSV